MVSMHQELTTLRGQRLFSTTLILFKDICCRRTSLLVATLVVEAVSVDGVVVEVPIWKWILLTINLVHTIRPLCISSVSPCPSCSYHREKASAMAPKSLTKLKSVLWGDKPEDVSLLIKLDFTILPYFSLIWFLFGLSRSSYGTAYISGMKEDLHFKGKDFNYLNTTYLVVYAVCQMPATSLLTIAPPKYIFVAANVTWSVLTLITFKMDHVWQIIVSNAFEGGFSAVA
jgi:hypothetical protein